MKERNIYSDVVIPDADSEKESVHLRADVTTFDDGTKHFIFSEHEANQSPRWDNDKVRLRGELVNAITGNGDDLSPGQFRYFEYHAEAARPYEEYAFRKKGQMLQQHGTCITHSREQFGRINNPELAQAPINREIS